MPFAKGKQVCSALRQAGRPLRRRQFGRPVQGPFREGTTVFSKSR